MGLICIEDFSSLTLKQINDIEDIVLKKEMLKLYNEEIKKLENDRIGKMFIEPELSLEEMAFNIEEYVESMCSQYLFEGDIVKFYPIVKEVRAKKDIICQFSGSKISKGSLYCSYKVFIQNDTSKKRFVLDKTINVELSYRDMLPTDLKSFERFIYNLDNSYENQGETEIDYYSISSNIGKLELRELGVYKKQKIIKKQK